VRTPFHSKTIMPEQKFAIRSIMTTANARSNNTRLFAGDRMCILHTHIRIYIIIEYGFRVHISSRNKKIVYNTGLMYFY